jgi:hypothetical protein
MINLKGKKTLVWYATEINSACPHGAEVLLEHLLMLMTLDVIVANNSNSYHYSCNHDVCRLAGSMDSHIDQNSSIIVKTDKTDPV